MITEDASKATLLRLAEFLCRPSDWLRPKASLPEDAVTSLLGNVETRTAYDCWLAGHHAMDHLSLDATFFRRLNDAEFRRATELAIRPNEAVNRIALRLAAAINQNILRSAVLKTERLRIQEFYGADLTNFALRQAPTLARDLADLVSPEHEPTKQGLSLIGVMLRAHHDALFEVFSLRFPEAPVLVNTISDRQLRNAWLVAAFEGA